MCGRCHQGSAVMDAERENIILDKNNFTVYYQGSAVMDTERENIILDKNNSTFIIKNIIYIWQKK